ncbi:MAG: hypothetical protein MJZ64_07590 [Paludibacteraceae bacterium]|nr:hypothetical protein [Paludibacteraceae bacterium]
MAETFIKEQFLLYKYLLSMAVREERHLPTSCAKYANIRSVCSQLKKQGRGVWSVSKKHCIDTTHIIREA